MTMSPRYVYVTNPIDVWPDLSLWKLIDALDKDDFVKPSEILFDFAKACVLASKAGWEGDFSTYPRVLWLPEPSSGQWAFGFAWKQHNNGTCFVVSPLELVHLKEYEVNVNNVKNGPRMAK